MPLLVVGGGIIFYLWNFFALRVAVRRLVPLCFGMAELHGSAPSEDVCITYLLWAAVYLPNK